MPTLKEMRRWMRGGKIKNLPSLPGQEEETEKELKKYKSTLSAGATVKLFDEDLAEKVVKDTSGMAPGVILNKRYGTKKWKFNDDATDVELRFGKWYGNLVSHLVKSSAGRGYLTWMLKEEFPEPIKKTIQSVLSGKGLSKFSLAPDTLEKQAAPHLGSTEFIATFTDVNCPWRHLRKIVAISDELLTSAMRMGEEHFAEWLIREFNKIPDDERCIYYTETVRIDYDKK